ncbi:acyl-homoserine-lactone synthase [Serratia microhaemolytica]|uniref:acyl-homoserine-lactone synthase n=1 Tax=Serratia microhaemolytica TaxID=2675110 RepID=UPI000FDDC951|nr:acyl-homoserine-lactone synthase [Serratia microhaemolytica]
MLEIISVNHDFLSERKSEELFALRKEVFKDRLNWSVNCINGLEFDEYDDHNANYLFGIMDDTVICGSRLIEMQYPNMIVGTFASCFENFTLPEGNYIESSRFFVDKARAKKINRERFPISLLMFLATINYSRNFNYDGILTIVSHSMFTILERSGWKFTVISKGLSEKNESIYLLNLPNDVENQNILIDGITKYAPIERSQLKEWPLICSVAAAEAVIS